MGIETDWKLKANKKITQSMADTIAEISTYDWWDFEDEKTLTMTANWYDSDKHMLLISEHLPDITFTLSGIDEMHNDLGKRTYLAGREIVKERKPRRKSKEKAALELLTELVRTTPTNDSGEICQIAYKAKLLLEE